MALGIGIELAPSAVRIALLERVGPRTKLVTAREWPCDTGNGEALTRVLAQARQALRLARPVVLGVPDAAAIIGTVNPLVANPKRAMLGVQFELQQQLPFDLRDAAWHFRWWASTNGHAARDRSKRKGSGVQSSPRAATLQPTLAGPSAYDAVVAAVRQARLREWMACCRAAGLDVGAVSVSAIGLLNACHARAPTPGPGASGASPSHGALLYLLNERSAEWIAWTPAALHVIPITSGAWEELWRDIAGAWESLRGQLTQLPASLLVTGIAGADAARDDEMAVRVGLSLGRLSATQVIAGAVAPDVAARVVAAVGLGLQGVGAVPLPLNLLATAQQDARIRRASRVAMLASGVCLAATVGLGASGMVEVRRRRNAMFERLAQRELLYQRMRPEVRGVLQRQQRLEQRSHQLEQLIGQSSTLVERLVRVSDGLPDHLWLTKFEWAKTDGGVDGLLEGQAKSFQDVTHLLDRLKALQGVTAVKPLSTAVVPDAASGKEVIAFSIQVQCHRATPTADQAAEANPATKRAAEPR